MGQKQENIDLTPAQLKEVIALVGCHLPQTEVWVYGSRAKASAKPHSDLDMVAFAAPEQNAAVYNLKEAFEESNLPFRVDLFVWNEVPAQFHKNIRADHVVLQQGNKN